MCLHPLQLFLLAHCMTASCSSMQSIGTGPDSAEAFLYHFQATSDLQASTKHFLDSRESEYCFAKFHLQPVKGHA
ncbi:hypothetical protein VNO80_12941 [Phaseolus coccineus]|uniref:Uncharacterized protein n=1 Tax=Phaseolus coccineus TaxID=3886 RepID=A0AAN9R9L6_PHACN